MKHADMTDGDFTWDTAERLEADKFVFGWEGKGPMEKEPYSSTVDTINDVSKLTDPHGWACS